VLCTKTSKGTLLDFLLNALDVIVHNPVFRYEKLQYCGKILLLRDWTLKVLISLAQHKRLDGVAVMRKHYPYLEGDAAIRVLPREFRWEFAKAFMESERLHCNFGRWEEHENRKHWINCRRDHCRNRYSKAGTWSNVCNKGYYWQGILWGDSWKCEKQHPPNDVLYDSLGWPKEH
jgi:hypothetical protein